MCTINAHYAAATHTRASHVLRVHTSAQVPHCTTRMTHVAIKLLGLIFCEHKNKIKLLVLLLALLGMGFEMYEMHQELQWHDRRATREVARL